MQINFRKSLRSMHQNQSQSESLKKIDLNSDDMRECNLYNEQVQSTKQSQSNTILNKLLLQPPSMKQNSQKKLSLLQNKKYEPKFQKPDIQNLIQENINLKNIIQSNNHLISTLKIKNSEQQKKIKLLEKGLEKFQKNIFTNTGKIEQFRELQQTENKENNGIKTIANQQKNLTQTSSAFSKTGMVHTQILKKKIADLTSMNVSAQNELKFLKKLPNVTIYQENDVQKEHLMAETIRLKSIISSLSEQLHQSMSKQNEDKFQNQFMRLMKEENEKLKATIRLLENDKILLKSRQTIQNKLNSDLKKQIQQLKSKLLYKESQLQKINNENKNLLFKKTTQFRQQQEKKQNEIVVDLRAKLFKAQNEITRLQQSNEFYNEQNLSLKQKHRNLTQEITETEGKYDNLIKKLNEEIEELQFQLNNVKNDYMNLLNAGSLKKKKSLGLVKQPSFKQASRRQSGFTTVYPRQEDFPQTNNLNSLSKKQKSLTPSLQSKQATYSRPIKWEDIQLPLTHVFVTLDDNPFITVESIIKNLEQNGQIKCGDLTSILMEQPFGITKKQAIKLARYIVEDQVGGNQRILVDQNLRVQSCLAKRIMVSSLEKMSQKLSNNFTRRWKTILDKTKKLFSIVQQFLENKSYIRKEELVQVIQKRSRQKVQLEEYDIMVLKCFDKVHSEEEFVLDTRMVLEWMQEVISMNVEESQEYN